MAEGSITIRIVFDGAPFAGKTTAAYSVGEALGGATETPSEENGRTAWFDWMTYTGGRHEGKAIRVELVTVPGQEHLSDRRRHLLEWGDVVVFIADSGASAFEDSLQKYEELRADLTTFGDIPVVVIANKRDVDDSLPLDEVRERLGLHDEDALVEGVATSGVGMRQAFIFAVRVALANSPSRVEATTADDLLAHMQATLLPGAEVGSSASADSTSARSAELAELPEPPPPPTAESAQDTEDEATVDEATTNVAEAHEDTPVDDTTTNVAEAHEDTPDDDTTTEAAQANEDTPDDDTTTEAAQDTEDTPDNDTTTEAAQDTEDTPDNDTTTEAAQANEDTPDDAFPLVPEVGIDEATFLHDAHWDRDTLTDDQAVVLSESHWRMLVDVANGDSVLRLADGTEAGLTAQELVSWGLLAGQLLAIPDDAVDKTIDSNSNDSLNDAELDEAQLDKAQLDNAELDGIDTEDLTAAERNERYRALRELRRSLLRH